MTPINAQTIALRAVTFLAADETLKDFLNDSGLEVGSFREQLAESGVLSAVLDFLMRNQVMFSQFCDAESMSADDVNNAWKVLAPFEVSEN